MTDRRGNFERHVSSFVARSFGGVVYKSGSQVMD